jgi:hypothetical protein
LDGVETIVLEIAASLGGFFLGTFLFSRVGSWVQAIATAALTSKRDGAPKSAIAVAAVLSSGPWLLAAFIFWAYYVLSAPHARAWNWFFGAVGAAVPIWLLISLYLHHRSRRIRAAAAKEQNAV